MSNTLLGIFEDVDFPDPGFLTGVSSDELFNILERLETPATPDFSFSPKGGQEKGRLVSQRSTSSSTQQDSETEVEPSPNCNKRRKLSEELGQDGQHRMLHITVERNRRKQMNEHLSVLRTLMPSFYVKRGDQASIIGGVVDYIKELQQVLHSLEAKKQRKVYSEVLSPRVVSSPRPIASTMSPRKPPLSPRVSLPASPRTPQSSPYKPKIQHGYLSPTSYEPSPTSSSSFDSIKDLAATSKSSIAEVEVKFSGANLLVKTISPRIYGQALKVITALEGHALEIIHMSIGSSEDTMVNTFTIKIGIECKLSADELADEIQQTFC